MVNTCAALDPMYVDVVSYSRGHFGSYGTYRIYIYIHLVLTYVLVGLRIPSTCDRDHTYVRISSARSCNCVTHN